MDTDVLGGDLVIATGSIRFDGTGREYLPIEFPAVANFEAVTALSDAAKSLNIRHHIGIVHSKDSFYGQHSPERMPVSYELLNKWEAFRRGVALASEMESSTLFIVSSVLKLRAGAVFLSVWNQERAKIGLDNPHIFDTDAAVRVAIEAIRNLIKSDKG
jgi:uridine phosphorylase